MNSHAVNDPLGEVDCDSTRGTRLINGGRPYNVPKRLAQHENTILPYLSESEGRIVAGDSKATLLERVEWTT